MLFFRRFGSSELTCFEQAEVLETRRLAKKPCQEPEFSLLPGLGLK